MSVVLATWGQDHTVLNLIYSFTSIYLFVRILRIFQNLSHCHCCYTPQVSWWGLQRCVWGTESKWVCRYGWLQHLLYSPSEVHDCWEHSKQTWPWNSQTAIQILPFSLSICDSFQIPHLSKKEKILVREPISESQMVTITGKQETNVLTPFN